MAGSYEDAIPKVTEALKAEGFGVLTEIDVRATIKKKLDKDFRKYIILGACNPQLAYQGLTAEIELGLLLPCNVLVYEGQDGRTVVSAQDPDTMLKVIGSEALRPVAHEARARLQRAIASLSQA
ncbi:MAG TPA: DUF302 domain-containing protein [Methylomirabilota bacterium]|nr:DUF302 domain-containing protein [Methylomirabilota bacterium]